MRLVRFAHDEFLCKASAEQIDLLCRAAAKNHKGEARVIVDLLAALTLNRNDLTIKQQATSDEWRVTSDYSIFLRKRFKYSCNLTVSFESINANNSFNSLRMFSTWPDVKGLNKISVNK